MSTNSTLLAPTPAVSTQDFAVMGILAGLTMEISFSGIISTAVRVFSGDASMGPGGFLPIAIIMSLFNSWSIIYNSLFVWTFFLNPTNCAVGQRATNVSSHFFYVTFDLFLLYKTYTVSQYNKLVFAAMGVILAHRIFWSIWDVVKSQGAWNEATDSCSYTQFPLTGAGYNAADIISDVFCTLTALAFNYQHLSSNLGETFKVIIQENILRSVIIVAVNSFEVYAAMNWTDPFLTLFAFLIQNYVYARCLNAELFWIEARKNATNNNGTTASHIGSHAGTATGSYVPGGTTVTSTAPKKEAN